MTRVSFNSLMNTAYSSSQTQSQALYKLQRQLATGMKYEDVSDNPAAAVTSERCLAKIRQNEQIIRNIETHESDVASAETYMDSIVSTLQRARKLALQAGNDTYATSDTQEIATEINEMLESLVATGNVTSGGRRLFAGSKIFDDAFAVTRDELGEITGVTYSGDEMELEIDANGKVPVTWAGDRVFARAAEVLKSTSTIWNGSTSNNYADRELAAAFIPSSGRMTGTLSINGVDIDYDLAGSPTSGEGDSLMDLAARINAANAGVEAEVTGGIRSNTASASWVAFNQNTFSTSGAFVAGDVTVNGSTISVTGQDTIFSLAQKINDTAEGVTASVYDTAGNKITSDAALTGATLPLLLRLDGGVEIGDVAAGSSNIMRQLGITTAPDPLNPGQMAGHNLCASVVTPYALQLTNSQPGMLRVSDASGSLAADLGLTSAAAEVDGGLVFDTFIQLRDALRAGESDTVRNTIVGQLDGALDAVSLTRSEAGTRINRLDASLNQMIEARDYARVALSDARDADLTEVIANLQVQMNSQTAALKATAGLMNLTLLNYLG